MIFRVVVVFDEHKFYMCEICGFQLSDSKELLDHVKAEHSEYWADWALQR